MNYHIYVNENNISANHNAAINEYIKRLSAFCNIAIHTCNKHSISKDLCRHGHGILIIKKGPSTWSSTDFANYISDSQISGISTLHIFIGFSDRTLNEKPQISYHASDNNIVSSTNRSLAENISNLYMSAYDFSHQTAVLLFIEQLYRAYTIINGKTYHK